MSPGFTMLISLALAKALAITESVPWKEAVRMGTTPRFASSCRSVGSLAVMAKMGHGGRYLAMTRAVCPVSVKAMISLPQRIRDVRSTT